MHLIVIGAGPGGLAAAFAAARQGAMVTLVERSKLGGTCLHSGCIPTKTLRASADLLDEAARAAEFGLSGSAALSPDMPALLARKAKVLATLETGLVKSAAQLKITTLFGEATLAGPGQVRVTATSGEVQTLSADRIILATGSIPLALPSLPVDHQRLLSSDDLLNLPELPGHLVLVGGGVIGCELACIFRSFGSKVTVVEGLDRLLPLPSVDPELSRLLQREMKKRGISVETGRTVTEALPEGDGLRVRTGPSPFVPTTANATPGEIAATHLCLTVGRGSASAGLGLEQAGVACHPRGWIQVNAHLETSLPGVFAIGDALGPSRPMLAHMAEAEAHVAVHNCLHPENPRRQDYTVVPSAIFTAPEMGTVGLTEDQAREQGLGARSAVVQVRELGKAQAMGSLAGLFKLTAEEGSGRLLGAQLAGAHSADLIAEMALALQRGCTANDLAETIHAHPTLAEGLREAAARLV